MTSEEKRSTDRANKQAQQSEEAAMGHDTAVPSK